MIIQSSLPNLKFPEDLSITDYVFQTSGKFEERVALVDITTNKTFTYKELKSCIVSTSHYLQKIGLSKGDVVCVYSPNRVELVIFLHAVLLNGAILAPANPLYTVGELKHHFDQAKPRFVLTTSQLVTAVESAAHGCISIEDIWLIEGSLKYKSLIEMMKISVCKGTMLSSLVPINPKNDTAFYLCSSGTTGPPKIVMLSHYYMIAGAHIMSFPEHSVLKEGVDTLVSPLPFYHWLGIMLTCVYPIRFSTTVIVMERFHLRQYLDTIVNYKVSFVPMVPPIMVLFCKDPLVQEYNLSCVRQIFVAAAMISKETIESFQKATGIQNVCQGYGLTEFVPISLTPSASNVVGSVGQIVNNTEVKITDIDTGRALGFMKEGEICARGVQMMQGYLQNTKATNEMIDSKEWIHTGDIGYIDKNKHLYVTDRLKELIKYNAFQVSPSELEALLLQHHAVADVAVLGVPDESAGELPRAYVVKKIGHNVTSHELIDFVAGKVSTQKKLRGGVVFVKEIPKSGSGKILRRILKLQHKLSLKSKI